MFGQGIATKYAIKWTAKHVFNMSDEKSSKVANICKWVVNIATFDITSVVGDPILETVIGFIYENMEDGDHERVETNTNSSPL